MLMSVKRKTITQKTSTQGRCIWMAYNSQELPKGRQITVVNILKSFTNFRLVANGKVLKSQ